MTGNRVIGVIRTVEAYQKAGRAPDGVIRVAPAALPVAKARASAAEMRVRAKLKELGITDGTALAAGIRALYGDPPPAQPRESAAHKQVREMLRGGPDK